MKLEAQTSRRITSALKRDRREVDSPRPDPVHNLLSPTGRPDLCSIEPNSGAFPPDGKTCERFEVNTLVAQVWFVQLYKHVESRYTARVTGSRRPLQTGQAWRSFYTLFKPLNGIEVVRVFENLLRFSSYEDYAPARTFFLAYAPLAFEHDASGEFIGPGVWTPDSGSNQAALRVRRTLKRWCEWLEALVHFQVHEAHFRGHLHSNLDKATILLWPLVKRHGWAYKDLLNVVCTTLKPALVCPYSSEPEFTTYCISTLGLRQTGSKSLSQGPPLPGQAIAERLIQFLPAFQ